VTLNDVKQSFRSKTSVELLELLMCVRIVVHNCRTQHNTEQSR